MLAAVDVMLGVEAFNRFECYLSSMHTLIRLGSPVKSIILACRIMYDTFHSNIEEKDIPARPQGEIQDVLCHMCTSARMTAARLG
jgi:D-psicose/D-tagatose/L-ribulose 3-epimerase